MPIELRFTDKGWTEVLGCLNCSQKVKRKRSHGEVRLDTFGNADILCECGEQYRVSYAVKLRGTSQPIVELKNYNLVRFKKMKLMSDSWNGFEVLQEKLYRKNYPTIVQDHP